MAAKSKAKSTRSAKSKPKRPETSTPKTKAAIKQAKVADNSAQIEEEGLLTLDGLKLAGGRLDQTHDDLVVGAGRTVRHALSYREFLMNLLLRIRDKRGCLRPLLLNRAQRDLEETAGKRNIVLKARQLGITTYVAARFFIDCITREGTLSVQVAHDQRSAEEIFRIVHRLLENLPGPLRQSALVTSRANVRQIVFPMLDCEYRVETAADDAVQAAWTGEYSVVSDFLPASDVVPANAVEVSAASRGANCTAIVREVEVQVVSLRDDRSQYTIRFSNDAAALLGSKFEMITLPEPLTTVFTTGTPSSSLYLLPLTGAQVTSVIASLITVDAGIAPPAGGGIEVRRSDGGWGAGNDGNLAGRFNTQTFNLPRLSRVQSYYLRQYDASTPAKYSRYSALLHVDYPL